MKPLKIVSIVALIIIVLGLADIYWGYHQVKVSTPLYTLPLITPTPIPAAPRLDCSLIANYKECYQFKE